MKKRNITYASWNSTYKNFPWLVSIRGNTTWMPWRLIYLLDWWSQKIKYTVKQNYNFMCIKTEELKFLDITNYMAPGFSYSQYLKAYKCTEQKGFFPYEWMTSLDKTPSHRVTSPRSLFQHLEEWEHLSRRLPAVPARVARERHEDHERFPCVV